MPVSAGRSVLRFQSMPFRQALSFTSAASCTTCPILTESLCLPLPAGQRNAVRRMARGRLVPQGQSIFEGGSKVAFFASILTGVVKVFEKLPDDSERIVTFMYPPDFLGYTSGEVHRYSATAATEVQLCLYPRAGFHSMLEKSPGLRRRIFEKTSMELELAREWMVMLSHKSSYQRVAGLFAIFARRAQAEGCKAVQFLLPVSRSDLADYLGLTHETVCRNITLLRQKSLIELRTAREVAVPDIGRLIAEAGMLD